jgi:thioredoxin 2
MKESLHIVCSDCGTVNRLPAARLALSPNCGGCKQPLFTGKVRDLTAQEFQKHLSRDDIPLVIDFWAPWCGPCKVMGPQFAAAAAELEPQFRLAKVNTESQQQLGGQLNIRSIPTLVLFNGGREVARQSGAMSRADIIRWVKNQPL